MKAFIKNFIPDIFISHYHFFWSMLGVLIYKNPSKHIKVIGITGTNGKTSTTHIATDLLELCNFKVGSISTLRFKIGNKEWKNMFKMTMPGRMHIQKTIRDAINEKCDVFIMEITSEGIKQNRHKGIIFDTVVFLNITPEHIERHGSFENYKNEKIKLFSRTKHRVSIFNMDDKNAKSFISASSEQKIGFSLKEQQYDFPVMVAKNVIIDKEKIFFKVNDIKFESGLLGEFNVYNSLAALSICVQQRINLSNLSKAFNKIGGVDGRAEIVIDRPCVVVDYAHTPDGLEKIYSIKNFISNKGSKICVLGSAGGGRDAWKRPKMGEIADKNCDKIILTDEDPYDEDPKKIIDSINKGIKNKEKVEVILDRRMAINKALSIAQKDDIVFITGKGAEPIMVTAKGKIDWDDRKIVKEEYQKILG